MIQFLARLRRNKRLVTIVYVFVPLLLLGALAAAVVLIYRLQFGPDLAKEQSVWGAFGDYVGGLLNPLLGLVTISLLLLTYRLQQIELADTRTELKTQNDILSLQSFEQTFFTWLNSHSELVRDLRLHRTGGDDYLGRHVMRHYLDLVTNPMWWSDIFDEEPSEFYLALSERHDQNMPLPDQGRISDSVVARWQKMTAKESALLPVFRNLCALLRWISISKMVKADTFRQDYADIVKARLSDEELQAILLHAMTPEGEELRGLSAKYGILSNIPPGTTAVDYVAEHYFQVETARVPLHPRDGTTAPS